MPIIKLPLDSNVTLSETVHIRHHYYPALDSFHIYLAFGAVILLVFVSRLTAARKRWSQRTLVPLRVRSDKSEPVIHQEPDFYRKDSPISYPSKGLCSDSDQTAPGSHSIDSQGAGGETRPLRSGFSAGQTLPQVIRAIALLVPTVGSNDSGSGGPLAAAQEMGRRSSQRKDASSSLEQAASRGVSTSTRAAHQPPSTQQNPSSVDIGPEGRSQRLREDNCSSPDYDGAPRSHEDGSDGSANDQRLEGRGTGKGKFKEQSNDATWMNLPGLDSRSMVPRQDDGGLPDGRGFSYVEMDSRAPKRLPLPPSLTPPTLSSALFNFQDRRHPYAVSVPPQLDTSFTHQPNLDYDGSPTSADVTSTSPRSATSSPGARRRSYNKSLPIGIPNSSSTPSQGSSLMLTSLDAFSPASYPPTSPTLPPPPPGHEFGYDEREYAFDDPNAPPVVGAHGKVHLHAHSSSVTDDSGHGWKRHTRVYGGGVCMACAASGQEHGGFYGDKVPPEQRR